MTTTELIETVEGYSCEVYAIFGCNRKKIGTAVPQVEFYETKTSVSTVGINKIDYKRIYSSIVVCPDPEMSAEITQEMVEKIRSFDLTLKLRRLWDDVIVPINVFGINRAAISEDEWRFYIDDPQTVRDLRVP